MKKLSLFLLVFIIAIVASYSEEVFFASYDKTFSADKAKGNPNAVTKEEVNLETLGFYLKKGIKGCALLNGVSDELKPLNLIYKAKNNIDEKEGSISFWVKPVNWQGSDKNYQLLFEAKSSESWILVYKYQNSSDLLFLLGQPDDGKRLCKWSVVRSNIKSWDSAQWHSIVCTWTPTELQLYIDGELKGKEQNSYPAKIPFDNFAVGGLEPDKWNPSGKQTLIDELKIYDNVLSRETIYKTWINDKQQGKTSKIQIGIGKRKVIIDGVIQANEYAFSGTGFFNLNGIYSHIQSDYCLSYDQDNIYIAVSSPVLKPFLTKHTDHDSNVYQDDSVEVFLSPDPKSRQYFQLVFNVNAVILDAKTKDSSWDAANFPISTKIGDKFWTIEMAIPYKSLGTKFPQKGDCWKINICRSFPGLGCYTSISPNKKSMLGYHDFDHFPTLEFIPELPITSINKIGNLNKAELDLNVSYFNDSKITQKYRTLAILDSAGKCLINKESKGELKSNESAEFTVAKKNFDREGYFKLELTNQESSIFSGEFAYKDIPPFNLVNIYTELDKQNVIVKYKFNEIISDDESLLVEMINKKNNQKAISKIVKTQELIFTESLSIADIQPGFYELVTSLLKDGKLVYKLERDFEKPETPPIWADNTIGYSEKVPAPWTPLQVVKQDNMSWLGSLWNSVFSGTINNFELLCQGRTIQYTSVSLFPTQLKSQEQKLLAKPVSLNIEVNGKTLDLSDINFDLTESKDTVVKFNSEKKSGNLDFEVTTQIEYDGFMWFEITVKPNNDSATIDSMSFDIPMTRQACTLLHTLYKGYNRPELGTGVIPANGWKANIFEKPIIWVGNEDAGIQWFAETLEDWDLKNENNSLNIIPQKDSVLVRLTIVDHPIMLTKTKKIAFGIMATPTRPQTKNWRKIRLQKTIYPWFPYSKYFNYPDKNYVDEKHGDKPNFKKDKTFALYHAIYGFTPFCPEWPYWAMQWERVPPPRGTIGDLHDSHWTLTQVCANSKSYRDFYLYKISNAIRDMEISNLYFDLGVPRVCNNHCHGCGWKDMNGKLRNTYNILGTRDIAKRIYVDFKKQQPDGLIINHMSEEPAMPVLSFADILVDGELYCLQVAEDESYYNIFTPELFRAAFLSRQWGPLQCFIPQFERSSTCYRPERAEFWKTPEAQPSIQHFIGYLLAHDTKCWPIFGVKMDKIWEIQEKFGWDDNVKFIPYWDDNNPIRIVNNKNNRIMLSTYEREGQYMFVLFNDTDENQNLTIKSRLKKPLTNVIDTLSGKHYRFEDDHLKVDIPKRSYILFSEKE